MVIYILLEEGLLIILYTYKCEFTKNILILEMGIHSLEEII